MNIADYVIIIELLIKIILALLSAFLAFLSVAFLSVFLALLSVSPFVCKPFCLEAFVSGHVSSYAPKHSFQLITLSLVVSMLVVSKDFLKFFDWFCLIQQETSNSLCLSNLRKAI